MTYGRGWREESRDPHPYYDAKCIKATKKALWIQVGSSKFWVPKAVVHEDSDVRKTGDAGTLVVEEWWAGSRGAV